MPCINPLQIKSPYRDDKTIYVPCGRCAWCRKAKRDEWFIRFKLESSMNKFTKFITLTYTDENLPVFLDEDTGECGFRARTSDIQKFVKRMRKAKLKFKYFIVSEYAPKTLRPHYHGILFSDKDIDDNTIRKHWKLGVTDTQHANEAQLKYVVKYILKGNNRDGNIMLCSKRPAIANGYVKKEFAERTYHLNDDGLKSFSFPLNGRLLPMPRYLKKKLSAFIDSDDLLHDKMQTLLAMENRDKFYYLEKKFKDLYNSLSSSLPEDEFKEKFLTSIRFAYTKDNLKQFDINNKEFNSYATRTSTSKRLPNSDFSDGSLEDSD